MLLVLGGVVIQGISEVFGDFFGQPSGFQHCYSLSQHVDSLLEFVVGYHKQFHGKPQFILLQHLLRSMQGQGFQVAALFNRTGQDNLSGSAAE